MDRVEILGFTDQLPLAAAFLFKQNLHLAVNCVKNHLKMENLIHFSQIIIALSVLYVWTFRFHNVLKEFEQFGLSHLTRNFVGATKIALATLLVAGIWVP